MKQWLVVLSGLLFVALVGLAPGCESASGSSSDTDSPHDQAGEIGNGSQDLQPSDGSGGGECDAFCAGVVAACPEEDTIETCLHSCTTADKIPSQTAQECAAAASDCAAAHVCWQQLFN